MAYSDLMLWLACAAAVLIAVYVTGYLIFLFQKHVLAPDKALMCCLISGFVRKKDIQDIIRRGADPDFDNGLPLLTAVRGTVREQAIRGLIECGADVNLFIRTGAALCFMRFCPEIQKRLNVWPRPAPLLTVKSRTARICCCARWERRHTRPPGCW